jgi:5-methylcytosine-specific restriction enzyme subunit McrC
MWPVFEDFVTGAVKRALELPPPGGRPAVGRVVETQAKGLHLDTARRIRLIPDLVCYRTDAGGQRTPIGVLDAKYAIMEDADRRAAVYQILAYCTALGLPRGHLVYAAADTREPSVHTLVSAGLGAGTVTIVMHPLDLTASQDDLLGQIARIAAAVVAP